MGFKIFVPSETVSVSDKGDKCNLPIHIDC